MATYFGDVEECLARVIAHLNGIVIDIGVTDAKAFVSRWMELRWPKEIKSDEFGARGSVTDTEMR